MNDPEVARLMKAADVGMMRYPGGSYADIYHWETHTAPGGYVAPEPASTPSWAPSAPPAHSRS
ncbi:hypothetical protein ACFQ3Z_04470 [Streptomyces nogalater]